MSEQDDYKTKYISVLTKYMACEKALAFAKEAGIINMAVKPLGNELNKLEKKLDEYNRKISEEMVVKATNVIKLDESWYAVTLLGDKGKKVTAVDPLIGSDVGIVARDSNTERDLMQKDYERIRPGIIDSGEIERHEAEISGQAEKLLVEYWGIRSIGEYPQGVQPENVVPSVMALQWWVENGVSDKERYKEGTLDQALKNDIVAAFSKANLEFLDSGGVSYFVDKKRLLLFTVIRGVLLLEVSRYDFGFIPRINRQILAGQIKYVNILREFTDKEESRIVEGLAVMVNEDTATDAAIKDLENQLSQQMQRKLENQGRRFQCEAELNNLRATLQAETVKVYATPRLIQI